MSRTKGSKNKQKKAKALSVENNKPEEKVEGTDEMPLENEVF